MVIYDNLLLFVNFKYEIIMDIIGYFAAFIGIVTFIPQTFKTIKTKNTKQISLISYIIFSFANFMWLIFGLLVLTYPASNHKYYSHLQSILWSLTLIIPYTITFIATLIIIYIKVKNVVKFNEKWKN
ncbi:MtN3 and saliva related transmembrane protein (plasmid) [Spiroplasma ixodetis Y32]|nr:MtN3 and saliva related transmembrane protein [Spiroplasma ixodetis Y32]